MTAHKRSRREFARVQVHLRTRFRILKAADVKRTREQLLEAPSMWAPDGESSLEKLASGVGSGSEGLLARALLDVSRQVARLNQRTFEAAGPADVGSLCQISGGGGLFHTSAALLPDTVLDLRIVDEDLEAPPVRLLAEVLRLEEADAGVYAVRILAVHPIDRERLVRFVYQVQRRNLREAGLEKD